MTPAESAGDETGSPQPPSPSELGGRPAGVFSLLTLLALLSCAHQFNRSSLAALSGPLMAAFGKDEVELGQLMTAFFLTYTIAMVSGGWLADRIGTYQTLCLVGVGSLLS